MKVACQVCGTRVEVVAASAPWIPWHEHPAFGSRWCAGSASGAVPQIEAARAHRSAAMLRGLATRHIQEAL